MIGRILFYNKLIQEGLASRLLKPAKSYIEQMRAVPRQLRTIGIRSTWRNNPALRHTVKAKGAEGALYGAYKAGYKKGGKDAKKGKI